MAHMMSRMTRWLAVRQDPISEGRDAFVQQFAASQLVRMVYTLGNFVKKNNRLLEVYSRSGNGPSVGKINIVQKNFALTFAN